MPDGLHGVLGYVHTFTWMAGFAYDTPAGFRLGAAALLAAAAAAPAAAFASRLFAAGFACTYSGVSITSKLWSGRPVPYACSRDEQSLMEAPDCKTGRSTAGA